MPSILAERKTDSNQISFASHNRGNGGERMAAMPALQKKDIPEEEMQMKTAQLKTEALQKQGAGEEEELPVQGKFTIQKQSEDEEEPAQMKAFELKSAAVQKAELPEEEPLQKKPFQLKTNTIQKAGPTEEELPVQGKFQTVQKKENKTGLPDNLKSGVEQLSGHSLDDVQVHYNSAQPAQLNALAYAQGTDIHVAPGQEKHLPHEAWHVAQQKQGRVQPTMQMKAGVAVNDDPGLENEADVMGAKAVQMKMDNSTSVYQKRSIANKPVQRYPISKASATSVAADSGRPNAKSNKSTIQGIIARIYSIGALNGLETLLKNLNDQSQAVEDVDANNFLSKNGAAICHKQAVSEFENQFVFYANLVLSKSNSSTHDQHAIQLVKDLTQLDKSKQTYCLVLLQNITNVYANSGLFSDQAQDVAGYLTSLILELDGSHSNLYIGYSRTNSSISANFDPHYDTYSTNDPSATPISKSIYYSQKDFGDGMGMGHSSPRRYDDGTDKWNQTSGVPDKGWIIYDQGNDKHL